MFKWIKNKVGSSINNTKLTSEKLIGVDRIKESSNEIKNMSKHILTPNELIKNAKVESFSEAMKRLGVKDDNLILNYKNFTYICYSSLFFSLVSFSFIFYQLFIKQSLLSSIPGFAILIFCLANAFKFSFRAFQIKHQKLCTVKEWYERTEEWIPKLKG